MDAKFEKITENELNETLREKIANTVTHISDTTIHVSSEDREKWTTGSSIGTATSAKDGLMSYTDKTKLDNIAIGANNYIHPDSGITAGKYLITTIDKYGHAISGENPSHVDITVTNSDQLGGKTADSYASLTSPIFIGNPTAPTKDKTDLTDSIATTRFVHNILTASGAGYIHPVSGITEEILPEGTDIVSKDSTGIKTFSDIATKYPTPVKNWLVKVTPDPVNNPTQCDYYLYDGTTWNLVDINLLWKKSFLLTTVNKYGHVVAGSNPTSLDITVTNANNLGGNSASLYAKLASPSFSGIPTVPTASAGTNNSQIANTAFVYYSTTHSGNLPIGMEFLQINPNPPGGCLAYNGQVVSRSLYPLLWNWIQSQANYLISESNWGNLYTAARDYNVPYYSTGDGSTTFRLPNICSYVRGAGNRYGISEYQNDTIKNITGTFGADDQTGAQISGAVYRAGSFNYDSTSEYSGAGIVVGIDASRSIGSDHISGEIRPKTIVGIWCVKAAY